MSRLVLCAAVKRAFEPPDLAETGEAALALARLQSYDLVLLDVMMPGMDGFEVCTKIRQTACNGSTPVLFVTALRDFDTRAKSLTTGGNDLLGKPFLTFDLTVKALTLVLRARLRERNRIFEASGGLAASSTPAVHWPELRADPVSEDGPAAPAKALPGPERIPDQAGASPILLPPPPVFADAIATRNGSPPRNAPREFSPAFLRYMTASVGEMKGQIAVIGGLEEEAARKELLVRLYLQLQFLSRSADLPELRPAFELCCALEGLLKKLKDDSKRATASALRTAAAGVDLLQDLCVPGLRPDLASNPPVRILVVDDEPVARRAITGAMQMAFPRPVGADSGETAVGLAVEKEFDLVFLDVCMPVMDGFTVCSKIHETTLNRSTPVVFITSRSDEGFRAQSALCGGSDYVVKPFVFMEITVKALTFVLRGRLEKLRKPPAGSTTADGQTTRCNPTSDKNAHIQLRSLGTQDRRGSFKNAQGRHGGGGHWRPGEARSACGFYKAETGQERPDCGREGVHEGPCSFHPPIRHHGGCRHGHAPVPQRAGQTDKKQVDEGCHQGHLRAHRKGRQLVRRAGKPSQGVRQALSLHDRCGRKSGPAAGGAVTACHLHGKRRAAPAQGQIRPDVSHRGERRSHFHHHLAAGQGGADLRRHFRQFQGQIARAHAVPARSEQFCASVAYPHPVRHRRHSLRLVLLYQDPIRPGALWDSWRIKLPVFGDIAHSICLARFSRTFSSLLRSGVPILSVMETASKVCVNVAMQKAVDTASEDIERGEGISDSLAKHPIFPDMMIRMMSAGEQTGRIDEMMERVADHLDEEIETTLSGLTSMIEPILIVFLGVVIGGIVICMFLPLFKLSSLVGGNR